MKKPCGKKLCRIACIVFLAAFFVSCSKNAARLSFTSSLDQIDALIHQNQFKDAAKELERAERYAYGSWAELGIFRRYVQISMPDRAEKVLVAALKKNPENPELNAVYVHFLMRQNRLSDAILRGKPLQGTKFGSVYSEAVLRDTLDKSAGEGKEVVFHSAEYFPVYYDAYIGTKDNAWLRNCALLRLADGAYQSIAALKPAEVFGADDAFFWALALYDGGFYADSLSYAETAKRLYPTSSGKIRRKVPEEQLYSIIADSYVSLSDAEMAENVRLEFLQTLSDSKGGWLIPQETRDNLIFPITFTNSAKWARDNADGDRCVALLTFCADNWPDFVPALTAYASFALESSSQRAEDSETQMLRDAGLATLEMERYDSRARIPVSDAVYRIDASLARTKSPLLSIVRLDIRYKTEQNLSEKEKTADIWRILERNMLSPSVYDEELLGYAENYFLSAKLIDDAWKLFYKYIGKKYDITPDASFWTNVIRKLPLLSQRELELAAYFASLSLRADDALCLYEAAVFEAGDSARNVFVLASDGAVVNLAMLYSALGKNDDALALYSRANGRSSDVHLKSVIMYRMAEIYFSTDDLKNSRRCAEYAVTLDSKNAEARLLLAKIKQKQA